jgi:hypothetical protein
MGKRKAQRQHGKKSEREKRKQSYKTFGSQIIIEIIENILKTQRENS